VSVHHLIVTYGYLAVVVLVAVESVGVPLPGETTLVAAATYAGTDHRLSIWAIFACAAAAAIVGDTIGYWIGDKGGYWLVYRYGRVIRLDEGKIKVARYLFDHHGGAVVFWGRFVAVLRAYAAFLAGTARMRYRRFLAFNAAGGVVWAALYAFVAYTAGTFLSRASTLIEVAFAVGAVLAIAVGAVIVRRRIHGLQAAAEAAYPGPLARPGLHRSPPADRTEEG
jgi:membrane protein DedA with SNARE-associated domain